MQRNFTGFSLLILIILASCQSKTATIDNCICLNKSDSIKIFQTCLNAPELEKLYKAYGDTTITILGNGYIRTNYDLKWKGNFVSYVSPQMLKNCLHDQFIIQFTKFEIVNSDNVTVTIWLQKQGSGTHFVLQRIKDQWILKNTEIYLN